MVLTQACLLQHFNWHYQIYIYASPVSRTVNNNNVSCNIQVFIVITFRVESWSLTQNETLNLTCFVVKITLILCHWITRRPLLTLTDEPKLVGAWTGQAGIQAR